MLQNSPEVLMKLEKTGFAVKCQSDSHLILRHANGRQTFIPVNPSNIPTGTFRAILKQAGLTENEFRNL